MPEATFQASRFMLLASSVCCPRGVRFWWRRRNMFCSRMYCLPCKLAKIYQLVGGTCCLHRQNKGVYGYKEKCFTFLKIEAKHLSEIFVNLYHTLRHHIPEKRIFPTFWEYPHERCWRYYEREDSSWDETTGRLVNSHWNFGGALCPHYQVLRIIRRRNTPEYLSLI
jgi:hypothetical protein